MMQPPRPAAWIAALLLVASLGFMPREGSAWDKQISPVIDPTNEGEPDQPYAIKTQVPVLVIVLGRVVTIRSFEFHLATRSDQLLRLHSSVSEKARGAHR